MAKGNRPTEKIWKVRPVDLGIQKTLSDSLKISPIISKILINRGIVAANTASMFLSSTLSDIRSPMDMKGMKEGARRILQAAKKGEKVAIFGDYDVDGITSTSVLLLFLKKIGSDASFYIPDRMTEGYGLNERAIRSLAEKGVSLIVTVDCGITSHKEASVAGELGMDLIITDHHEVPDELPTAYSIINPKQPGCPYPFKELAGVGVAFNLVIAMRSMLREDGFWSNGDIPNLKEFLDLVALGTVADVVPLTDENRIFVKHGLTELTNSKRPGIIALKEVSRAADVRVTAEMVGYRLAPRINASGRVGTGADGVRLLTSDSYEDAIEIARILDEGNRERQSIEEVIIREAIEMVESDPSMKGRRTIVLASEEWHPGVIGIVASRLVDIYYRPAVLISIRDGIGKGSARSIHSFMLYEGLKSCSELLEGFGGHDYAAGLSIKRENIGLFREKLETVAAGLLKEEDLVPEIVIDAEISLRDVTEELIADMERLAPYGEGNAEPLFCARDMDVSSSRTVGKGHLKMKLRHDTCARDAIGFGMGDAKIGAGQMIDAAFTPQINEWSGGRTVQLKLVDIKTEV